MSETDQWLWAGLASTAVGLLYSIYLKLKAIHAIMLIELERRRPYIFDE